MIVAMAIVINHRLTSENPSSTCNFWTSFFSDHLSSESFAFGTLLHRPGHLFRLLLPLAPLTACWPIPAALDGSMDVQVQHPASQKSRS